MTHAEFADWCSYRSRCGPLDAMVRNDYAMARLMLLIHDALSAKPGRINDYLLWREDAVVNSSQLATMFAAKLKE